VSAAKKRLLIVDDDHDIAEALTLLLSDRYAVDHAANGRDALERIAATTYDLILLDLAMPVMDGGAVVRALRERAAIPPILLMSGSNDLVERAAELEIDTFLPKPVEVDVLNERIAGLLARRAA
jgi:DNA-binding response OmpR family regulator